MQTDTAKPWTWRVEQIPRGTTPEQLKLFFVEADRCCIEVESLVPESTVPDLFYHEVADYNLTATISFRAPQGRRPQLVDEYDGNIYLDPDFYGFTSLYSPENEFIAAELVCPRFGVRKLIDRKRHSCDRARGPCIWLLDACLHTLSDANVAARLSTQKDSKH